MCFIYTEYNNKQYPDIISAAFSPQPEEEILHCLKSHDPEAGLAFPETGGRGQKEVPTCRRHQL